MMASAPAPGGQLEAPPSTRGLLDPARRLRFLGIPMIGLLGLEFLLGMVLNLYGTIPAGTPLAILEADPILIGHVVIGGLLVGITAQALRLGLLLHERRGIVAGALGLLSALGAFLGGMDFTFGGQSASASFVMSIGFTGILGAAAGLLVPRPVLDPSSRPGNAGERPEPSGAASEL
jgi:hypothetical protein